MESEWIDTVEDLQEFLNDIPPDARIRNADGKKIVAILNHLGVIISDEDQTDEFIEGIARS